MKRVLAVLFISLLLLIPTQIVQAEATAAADTGINHSVKLGVYYVQSGDTLWLIAQRYRTTVNSIQQLNNLSDTMIYVGQALTVPTQVTLWREAPPAQPPTPPSSSYSQDVLRLTNVERTKAGLAPLANDDALARVAQEKARDMQANGYFSHTSPTYGSPFDMMKQYGVSYSYAAENIAKGYRTPNDVVAGWMGSSGHRANILNANLTNLGVGVAGDVWVQMFRRP